MRTRPALAVGLFLLWVSAVAAAAQGPLTEAEPTADTRSPWRVFSLDVSNATVGAWRWSPALAAEPHPYLRAGELPRMRPAISWSRGGPVVMSLVGRGDSGLLLTLQFTP